MSYFRLWIHHKLARLDGARERRLVAFAATLIFASLALGPQALRAVDNIVNAPAILPVVTGEPTALVPTETSTTNIGASPTDTGISAIVSMLQLTAWPGTEPKIEAKGSHSGFIVESASFRIQSITGLAFLGEYPAVRGTGDTWHLLLAVPGGSLYKVTLIAQGDSIIKESLPMEVMVPLAELTTGTTPNVLTTARPRTVMLLPGDGSELMSPVPLAVRVTDATATAVVFEILDPAGVTRSIPAGPGTAGEWMTMFIGEAGQYRVGARTTLNGDAVIYPDDFRSFRILAAATDAEPLAAVANPVPTPITPADEPVVELFSPSANSKSFLDTVPLSARIRNGLPTKVVAIVTGIVGNETIIIASKTPTGDYWNALFEGPDGEYRFRMRAQVGDKEVFSPERRFAVKHPVTTAPPTTILVPTETVAAPIVADATATPLKPADDAREDISHAREYAKRLVGAQVRREELPASIAALLPVEDDQSAHVRLLAVADAAEDSSPAILIIDTDGDGLTDDVEKRLGANPNAIDTDGDGFGDGDEVRNGYNPLGSGALDKPVRGIEKALLNGLAIEEPRGDDSPADDTFTIAVEKTAPGTDGQAVHFSGKAAPNSVVSIFVYSFLPIVVTTTTDANGNWTYDFGSKLAEGRHEAYVSVNDDTGKLVAASSPLDFFIKEARAVSEQDFLRPDVNVEETHETFSRWFIYGGIGLVALALVLVVAIIRQTRKNPMTETGEGL